MEGIVKGLLLGLQGIAKDSRHRWITQGYSGVGMGLPSKRSKSSNSTYLSSMVSRSSSNFNLKLQLS